MVGSTTGTGKTGRRVQCQTIHGGKNRIYTKKKEKTSNKAPNGDFLLTRNPLGIARPVFVPTDLPALTSIAGGSYLTDE